MPPSKVFFSRENRVKHLLLAILRRAGLSRVRCMSSVSTASSTIVSCATCQAELHGPYCSHCGEKRLHRHDYALKHFLEHAVDTVTHLDLRVLRDIGWQARRPGWLAAEWLQGRRVRHAPPVQLFLITNLIFYLLAGFTNFSPFQTQLRYHLGNQNHSSFARGLVQQHLLRTSTTLEEFSSRFDASAHIYSKSLVFLFIPMLALALWLLFWRQRRYFVEWLSLSTYLFGGVLLVFTAMALLSVSARLVPVVKVVFNNDNVVIPLMFTLTTIYASFFFQQVFPAESRGWRWVKAFFFTFSFLLSLIIPYHFILFVVCYWASS